MKKTLDIKKLILLNMPYILLGLFATNFGEAWRMAQGADASEKFLSLDAVLPGALQSFWPSLHPLDLLVGLCCGVGLRLELYTIMRYLQYDTLQAMGLGHFDFWAAAFGETVTAIELSPEGTGYRAKTRFARFFNLPELISLFKESADIQTADMLNLPVPEAEYINEVLKPSEEQQELVSTFAERAEMVRAGAVESREDNMLKITNDGRKCALDQRLINDMLPDYPDSKVNRCVKNAFDIWQETADHRSTQLIFCDLSTPKNDGTFNVYDDVRDKLAAKGIPREEIAFIHEAGTETKKAELFAKVRSGKVRILLGSTPKLGAGTNIQDRLIALHHLDCPWVRLEVA